MPYLLDANVFISAKRLHYGFDFCPAFWSWLSEAHQRGAVFSVRSVFDELIAGEDDLSEWADANKAMFLEPSGADIRNLAIVNRWANDSADYDAAAKAEFASVADSFLVAQAIGPKHTIVTHERVSDSRRRIKIPNAAAAHGVKFVSPYTMLRAEHARFVLPGTP